MALKAVDHLDSEAPTLRMDIDLQLAPARERSRTNYPRITGYRILTVVLTAAFGVSKAKLSYEGSSTAPNTLDWLYGVVSFLILYWLGICERHAMYSLPWMFETDYLVLLWHFFSRKKPSLIIRTD